VNIYQEIIFSFLVADARSEPPRVCVWRMRRAHVECCCCCYLWVKLPEKAEKSSLSPILFSLYLHKI